MKTDSPQAELKALEVLVERSKTHAYDLEDLEWSDGIDRGKYWSPVEISPLSHLPSYPRLTEEQKKRYNQLFALGVCEQFIWLEEHILVNTLRSTLKKKNVPHLLREALEYFIEEEIKHTEMFRTVLRKAEPGWYPDDRFALYNISALQQWMLDVILKFPHVFLIWIWTAIFFEERTVDYCKHYIVSSKRNPEFIDSNFVLLHKYHYKDEVRHYQLDQHLLKWLYDPQPLWKKNLSANMFYTLIRSYVSPHRTTLKILEVMQAEFDDLSPALLSDLKKELPGLAHSESFHKIGFSKKAIGKTLKLFARYPELDRIWDLFLLENKTDYA